MSQAGAISASALTRAASAGASAISARSNSSAMSPPMLEPTSTCGPLVSWANAARDSSSQRPSVPSSNRPSDWPWPE